MGPLGGLSDALWLIYLAHSDKITKKMANTCRQTLNAKYHINKNKILPFVLSLSWIPKKLKEDNLGVGVSFAARRRRGARYRKGGAHFCDPVGFRGEPCVLPLSVLLEKLTEDKLGGVEVSFVWPADVGSSIQEGRDGSHFCNPVPGHVDNYQNICARMIDNLYDNLEYSNIKKKSPLVHCLNIFW